MRRPPPCPAADRRPPACAARRRWLHAATGSVAALAAAWAAAPRTAHAADITVAPGGTTLPEAVRQAQDGDTISVLPGDYRGQVALVTHKRLTIRGVGRRPVLWADGRSAEGKATLVVRGGEVRIENLEFRGSRVPDGNGAGIRFERSRLELVRCAFVDNQNGLLTANDGATELVVRDCEFSQAPRESGMLHHLFYAGRIGRLEITGSRFHGGFEGHLIKSRARETLLAYNLVVDGAGGSASYEVEMPNGGRATLIGNVIAQSAGTQNPVVVAYGAEGRAWPESTLHMAHNTLVNDRVVPAWFLRVFRERLPETLRVVAVNNLSVGPGLFTLAADGDFDGNWPAARAMLRDPDMLGYELPASSWLRGRGIDPRSIDGRDLSPKAEFVLPVGTRALPPPDATARWTPGAFQR